MKKIIIVAIGLIASHLSFGQAAQLRSQIEKIIENRELEIGFALYNFSTTDTLSINGSRRFPMQSVFKFPLALAILAEVDNGTFELSQKIDIGKDDLRTGLWSPIEKSYPNADVQLPLSEIVRYTVAQSDNVGCDLLLKLLGGPATVNSYIHSKGITDICIKNNEQELQSSWATQFDNWTTPKAMIELLKLFNSGELLKDDTHTFLWSVMAQTSTGSVRNKVPPSAFIAYKTGTSGYNSDNVSAATNCVGIISTFSGQMVAFAIFITNSSEVAQVNGDVIADIAQLLYRLN